MNWLEILEQDDTQIDRFCAEYLAQVEQAKAELGIDGHVEKLARQMPAITDKRFSQLQEIEAVLEHYNIKIKAVRSHHYKQYLEHYKRALSSRDVEKYIDGEQDVVELMIIINRVALVRNKFAGITKALEIKHFQITNIVKLKAAGLDDTDISI
ncbi:hypothetical protein [Marinobacter nauticus]|uniref:hypothetical protein n=1 Tax=Marinobacter nauticus TaxID=2743 RepID=UPI001C9946C1|nr:hypothetical protein [Marinobacter nauticus]MBY5962103.1 hypothetical protein [Marinobacter nauticus]